MKKEQVKGYVRFQNSGFGPRYAKATLESLYWVVDKEEATLYPSLDRFFSEFPLIVKEIDKYSFEPIEESVKKEQGQGVILNLQTGGFFISYMEDLGPQFTRDLQEAHRFNSFEEFCNLCGIQDAFGLPYLFVDLSGIIQKETEVKNNRTILQEAQDVVYGDRQADYGSVTQNFTTIAQLWSAVLGIKVSPEQVGLCMVQVKVARQMNKPKRDNLVDICGYAACLEKMEIENENLPF